MNSGRLWANALAVVFIVASWCYVLVGSKTRDISITLPEIHVVRTDDGMQTASFDLPLWRDACKTAGLPDPPDLNGTDPVPVQILFDKIRQWSESRDGEVLGEIGQIYLALELHEAALECFVAASELGTEKSKWIYFVAAESQTLGRDDLAVQFLDEAAKSDPDYATTYARLGLLYLENGDLAQAQTNYERYRDIHPNQSLGYVGLGRVALATGQADRAVELLTTAVQKTQNDYLAFRFLSQAFGAAGKPEEAKRASEFSERLPEYRGWLTFDERLQESHRLANTQRNLENEIRIAVGNGNAAQTLHIAERLLDRRLNDTDLLGMLAKFYHDMNRREESRTAIEHALKLNPDSSHLLRVQAEILFAQQNYEEAERAVDRLLRVDPQSARAYEIRGRLLFLQGNFEEAIAAVRHAIQLDPAATESRAVLIGILTQTERDSEAISTLEQWLQDDPNDQWARRQLLAIQQKLGPTAQ